MIENIFLSRKIETDSPFVTFNNGNALYPGPFLQCVFPVSFLNPFYFSFFVLISDLTNFQTNMLKTVGRMR